MDRDLTSVVVVRADSELAWRGDLKGLTVRTGAVDSPQATLIPLAHSHAADVDAEVRRFDVGVGLHGDHVGGERDAVRALLVERFALLLRSLSYADPDARPETTQGFRPHVSLAYTSAAPLVEIVERLLAVQPGVQRQVTGARGSGV